MSLEPRRLVVVQRWPAAEGVVGLRLRGVDGAALPDWTPGAHVDLHLANGMIRQFSLCGDRLDRDRWQIAVLLEQASRGGSRAVHENLRIGTELMVGPPRQTFALEPASNYLFIAGGIGITPILPMVAQAVADGVRWRLVYGGRRRSAMAFVPQLQGLAEQSAGLGRLDLHPQDEVGLIPLESLVDPDVRPIPEAVYCCGPPALLEATEKVCASLPTGTLRVERFSPVARDQIPPAAQAFEVEIASTATRLTVPADRSVLEVLQDAGLAPLSSCRQGTCGTCETGVLVGEIDHRDSLLTPAEQRANDTMFVCVSRAWSPRLVLDL